MRMCREAPATAKQRLLTARCADGLAESKTKATDAKTASLIFFAGLSLVSMHRLSRARGGGVP